MADNNTTRRAPTGLGAAGKALWRQFTARYGLDERETAALVMACRQADDIARLERLLDGAPDMVRGSMGQPTVHPAFGELRQARATLDRLLSRIAIPDTDDGGAWTPTRRRAQRAAQARWRGHTPRSAPPGVA